MPQIIALVWYNFYRRRTA